MLNFDEKHYLEAGAQVLDRISRFEAIGEALKDKHFTNIIVPVIGGTWARWYPVVRTMRELTKLPVHLENAADYCTMPPPYLCGESLIFTASNSGTTKEIVAAAQLSLDAGATVVSVGEPKTCPLQEASTWYVDVPLHYGENMYLAFYLQALTILSARGEFPDYDLWIAQMKKLHPALISAKQKFDSKASQMAKVLSKAPYMVLVSSGMLEKISYWYALCVLEECQWLRANSVSSADFFHGTLELMEDGLPILLIKGVDAFRVLDERVERFAAQTTDSLLVLDTAEYPLAGLDSRFAAMYSVFVAASLLSERLEVHLERNTGHSLNFRRYYRQLDY